MITCLNLVMANSLLMSKIVLVAKVSFNKLMVDKFPIILSVWFLLNHLYLKQIKHCILIVHTCFICFSIRFED